MENIAIQNFFCTIFIDCLQLDGTKTQNENIADNIGWKIAYLAYNEWVKQNNEEQKLPGLERYNGQQMFWISTANSWCSKTRPEVLEQEISSGEHSMNEFRILGTLSNIEEFSKDFNCPIGSIMNPVEKCTFF